MNEMIYYNDGDDLELVATLTDKEGTTIDPLSINWKITYYTRPQAAYSISCTDGVPEKCKIIDNEIHVYVDKHFFGTGTLLSRAWFSIPNENFNDGTQDVSTQPVETGIIIR